MKRTITLILLSAFLFNSLGFVFVFKFSQVYIKDEVRQLIDNFGYTEEEIVVLKLSQQDFRNLVWVEEDEFSYEENRFDLIKLETNKDGSVDAYCLYDKKETGLFAALDKNIKSNSDDFGKNRKEFSKLVLKIYCNISGHFINSLQNASDVRFVNSDLKLVPLFFDIQSPPPKNLA